LLLSGAISGAAGLDIYTNTTLSGANSFSGGVNLYAGSLTLGSNSALGAGDLNVIPEGGYSPSLVVDANRQVSNNLYLTPGSTSYSQLSVSGAGSLELKGTVTLQGAYTLNPSTFPLTLSGTVTGPGVLNVAGYAPLILSGSNSYQGGTTSSGGAAVFGSVASIPANGNLLSYYGGYIGLASTNFGGSGTYQSSFIDRFDKSSSTGAIGFDSLPNAQGQLTVNNFTGPVDLTGFTNPMRLGSATSAILSGPIVPQGNVYRFGGGGGKLEVTSGLTDGTNARSLELLTQMSGSLTLRLPGGSSAANTFSGGVTVKNAALVFGGGAGAMPSSGTFGLESFGYVGTEDTSLYGANLGAYLSRLNVGAGGAVVGFDLPSGGALTPVSGTVDLGRITIASAVATAANKDPAIFLGTTSKAEITGSIILPANQSVLRFTGYKGGELTVSSALSGAVGVQIGDQSSAASVTDPLNATGPMSTVILKGNNTYTGDTVLYAGQLVIGSNSALGTGQLKVSYGPYVPALNGNSSLLAATAAPSGSQWVVSNAVALDYAPLRLGGTNPFTLSGVISSLGAGISKTGTSVVTLTGANTFSGETIIEQGTLVFGSSQAAGGGGLALIGSGSPVAQFTAGSSILSGGLRGSGGLVQLAPSSSLLIIQGNDAEFAGAFGVNGSAGSTANLRFQGPGYNPPTLALSGASTTFAGTATIEAGGKVLIANPAALGTSSIMISGGKLLVDHELTSANPLTNPIAFNQTNGGSLGGNGTIERATTLRVGIMASLDPGSDLPGILSFKAGNGLSGPVLTLATGGALKIKLSDALDPLGGWDRINVAGVTSFDVPSGLFTVKLSFSGATDFAGLVNFDPTQVYNWPIISATSITGFSPNSIFIDLGSATLPTGASLFTSLNSAGDTLLLNYSPVAVPEPSTWALMLSGAAFLGFKLRRRRS
jgi:autotransporter-associated beta strand protein